MDKDSLGIHIALSKYPLGKADTYIERLENLFEDYKTKIAHYLKLNNGAVDSEIDQYLDKFYKPSIFHIFSHFDVAFISFVDNFKFPQRVFEPHLTSGEKIKSVSYQILSGEVLNKNVTNNITWLSSESNAFLKIVQLKLNNGLLVGNGENLFKASVTEIEKVFIEYGITNYLIVKSFNWGEIILLCENENPDKIANAVIKIRTLCLNQIDSKEIVDSSLYKRWGTSDIENSHLFSETLSYFGVDYNNFDKISGETPLKTQVEWQIKPGHLPYFRTEMQKSDQQILNEEILFKNGKTDYLVDVQKQSLFSNNKAIFNELRNNAEVRKHIRKVKTKALFNIDEKNLEIIDEIAKQGLSSPCNTTDVLNDYKINDTKEVNKHLRRLNISRNTRKKISKIIYNYNLGVQDPVLCIYFIDLHNIIKLFISEITQLSNAIEDALLKGELKGGLVEENYGALKSNYIETELIQSYVNILEEAFQDRILNNYNYEDINEFSLEINSSLTNVVSSFDSLVKFVGTCFRDSNGNAIVTTINDKATISNRISVNYNIEHLSNLPLIFATLIKEILNIDQTENLVESNNFFRELNKEFNKLTRHNSKSNRDFLFDFLKAYNFAYFWIDLKKYYLTFFKNTKLFVFWHWTYPFQCTHLYSSVGHFDEVNFTRELFRLLLVLKAVDEEFIDDLECPIPELKSYWNKYFNRILSIVDKINGSPSFAKMAENLKEQVDNSYYKLDEEFAVGEDKKVNVNEIAEEFQDLLKAKADQMVQLSVDDFTSKMFNSLDRSLLRSDKPSKSNYLRHISLISYYNLHYVADKFDYEVRLLRRDFSTGNPIDHFLQSDNQWFIDPFGGFFINEINERRNYMNLNNMMLHLVWHLSMLVKKDLFTEKENY